MLDDGQRTAREAALSKYRIMDTPAEAEFDDLVRIAAHVCRTPVALISLVTSDRQWFKARVGLDVSETPISQSVCSLGLTDSKPLVIPDLTTDSRTIDNPLVWGDPPMRFYAGAPLIADDGQPIGMLCVIDHVARPAGLDAAQLEMLQALSRQVMVQMEQRRSILRATADLTDALADGATALARAIVSEEQAGDLRAAEVRSRTAQEAGGIGTFEIELATSTITVSPEFCAMFGMPVQDAYPVDAVEALILSDDVEKRSTASTRAGGTSDRIAEYRIRRPTDGAVRWIRRGARFVRDDGGVVTHMIGTVRDNTVERLVSEEIAHRLKNTLSLVQAITTFSLRGVVDRTPVTELDQRLSALSTAHELLIGQDRAAAPLAATARAVLDKLGVGARATIVGPPVDLGPQSTLSLAMLLHELATNAVKYGALSVIKGTVSISWTGDDAALTLDWVESGGPPASEPQRAGFGSRLIARGVGGGSADINYGQAGVRARFVTALGRLEP